MKVEIVVKKENMAEIMEYIEENPDKIENLLQIASKGIIEYLKTHPKEIRGLIQYLGDEIFDVVTTRRVLNKLADIYRQFNASVNYSYKIDEKTNQRKP